MCLTTIDRYRDHDDLSLQLRFADVTSDIQPQLEVRLAHRRRKKWLQLYACSLMVSGCGIHLWFCVSFLFYCTSAVRTAPVDRCEVLAQQHRAATPQYANNS